MTCCGCDICRWHDAEMERCRAGIPWRGPTPDYDADDAAADIQLRQVLAHPASAHHDRRIPLDTVRAVWQRDNGRCQDCGQHRHLEAHHLTYRFQPYGGYKAPKYEKPIYGHETPDDLDLLCRSCHHRRHIDPGGEYWADPEEMANYWAPWYEATR